MNKIQDIDGCKRIQSTLMGHWKIEATLSECQGLWRRYSRDEWGADWISIPIVQVELTDALEIVIQDLKWSWDGPYAVMEAPLR